MYCTKCIRGSKTLIFTRVNSEITQTAAEWRRHHARSTQHTHKNGMTNKEKNGQQQKDNRGSPTFCVDKRPTYEKTCYTSAAKWEVRALGGSTIIYCKETITFNSKTLVTIFCTERISEKSSPPPGGILRQHRWGFTRSPRPAQCVQDTSLRGTQTWKKQNNPATNNARVTQSFAWNTREHV